MAASETEIANLALNHLGVSPIASFDEDSTEAEAMKLTYPTIRDVVLRDFRWPFATKFATLGLVERDPIGDEWSLSYRKPGDSLMLRRILSGARTDSRQSRIPYKESTDSGGKLILTDQEDAIVEYTQKITDTLLFPPDFTLALSYRLAHEVGPRLAAGDAFGLARRAAQMYNLEMNKASAQAFNEEQPDQNVLSEFERVREGRSGNLQRGQTFVDFINR